MAVAGYGRFARLPCPAPRPIPWRALLEPVAALHPFTPPPSLPDEPLWADPVQLHQVLVNLLKNAAESGSPPAAIAVTVSVDEAGWEIAVHDARSGMEEAVLRQALVPFYSTKKSDGGLGLALCREILEAHGCSLALASRPGVGTTARCSLPRPAPSQTAREPGRDRGRPIRTGPALALG